MDLWHGLPEDARLDELEDVWPSCRSRRISPKSNTALMCRKSGFTFASLDEFDSNKT